MLPNIQYSDPNLNSLFQKSQKLNLKMHFPLNSNFLQTGQNDRFHIVQRMSVILILFFFLQGLFRFAALYFSLCEAFKKTVCQ